jgi:hypothetical protein
MLSNCARAVNALLSRLNSNTGRQLTGHGVPWRNAKPAPLRHRCEAKRTKALALVVEAEAEIVKPRRYDPQRKLSSVSNPYAMLYSCPAQGSRT